MAATAEHVDVGPRTTRRSPLVGWLGVVLVALGIFAIVTAEILPIGLLRPVGSTFGISDGAAGLMMTLPGIVAAVAAPLVTVATARLDRRLMLGALMAVLAISNVVCALAPAYWMVLAARVLVGIVIGGFWSIGAGLAGRLVDRPHVGRATAVIFSAVPLGSVFGVPAGTYIGAVAGWRLAFAALAVLTVAVLVALVLVLPALPVLHHTRLSVLRDLVSRRDVRIGLLATFLIVVAHFGAYTYVTPFLHRITRIDLGMISTLLLVYGAAGVAGNFIGGSTVGRRPQVTFGAAAAMIATATLLLPLLGHGIWGVIPLLAIWGLAYGTVPVCSQSWIARSAAHAPEAATVLFTSCFQAAIAIGALAGGGLVDSTSEPVVMAAGGVVAVVAAVLIFAYGRPPATS